jgi:hypothetical protein
MLTTRMDVIPPASAAPQETVPDNGNVRGSRNTSPWRFLVQLVAVVGASAVLGGATSYAQTHLPDALAPFANSASGWTILTVLVVAACRAKSVPSAIFGAASFVALVLGYQVVSGLRGFPTSETLFLIVGVIVGPFVGIAASWLRRDGWRVVLSCGALSGIAVGEAMYGLILVVSTTGWFYWTLIGLIGLVLVARTAHRLNSVRTRLSLLGGVILVGAGYFFAFWYLGSAQLPF